MLTKSLEIHEQQTADLHHPLDPNCPFRNKKGTGPSISKLVQKLLRLLLGTGKKLAKSRRGASPVMIPETICGMHFGSSALLIPKVVSGDKHDFFFLNIKFKPLCLKFQEKSTLPPLADNALEILTGEGLKKTI